MLRVEDAVLLVASRKTRLADWLPFASIALFLLPIVVFWAYFHLYRPVSPYFEKYDPEFPYLMNSLEVFKGQSYYFADHPGTSMELLGTFFYLLIYPFLQLSRQDFILYNLQHPGVFLNIAHAFLTLTSMACAAYFFRLAKPANGAVGTLLAAGLATSYFALHPMTFSYTSWWSHSAFGFPAGALLLLLLLRELDHGSATEPSRRALVLLGIGTGIFASTTIYYGAWGVGMLLALLIARRLAHHPRQRAIADAVAFATSCVAGFGLMLLPIYNRVSYFFGFVVSLLNHTNSYVGTDVGPLLPRMASNLADLFNAAPQLVIASAVLLVVTALTLLFARMRLAEHPGLGGLACGLSAQVLVLYLVILNDYSSKYFLTVAVVLPILALALLKLYEWPRAVSAWWQVGAVLLLAAGLVVAFNAQLQSQLNLNAKIARRVRQQETSIAQYTRQTSKAEDKMIILWSIGTYSPCNSLWFGNAWAGFAFNQEMTKLCPNYYYVLTDQVSHVSKVSEDAKLVVQSLNSLNWDMFLGCRESFLQAVGTNAAQYNVFTPKPSSVINCGVGELGTFAIVTRK